MQCSECGAAGIAACDCGAPYMPAADRAAKAIAANPDKSDRAIAAEIGVDHETVWQSTEINWRIIPVDTRVGLDGKVRKMPQRKAKPEEVMPTDEEAEESLPAADLYDQACWLLDTNGQLNKAKVLRPSQEKVS